MYHNVSIPKLPKNIVSRAQEKVIRFKKFQLTLLGKSTDIEVSDKDVRNYFKRWQHC